MAEQIITKQCPYCKDFKPLSEFYKHKLGKYGYRSECKLCSLKQVKKFQQTEQGKEVKRKAQRLYRKTQKCKSTRKIYRQTEKCKARFKRYKQTTVYKVRNKRYNQSEKAKNCKKRYRQSAKGKITEKLYSQSKKCKIYKAKYKKQYYANYPEKVGARQAIEYAVKVGKLPRPDTLQCHYCPNQAKLYHHHKGYAREHWFDVVPACLSCHTKIHKKSA